jgi:serine/threonine-protein kinase RsbW
MAPVVPTDRLALLAADWFPGNRAAVGQAREFVRGVLGDDWPGLDDLLLMVSEICSNAVRHTASGRDGGWFDLTIAQSGNTARIAVADRGSASEPRVSGESDPLGMATSGRGLRIVDTLADRWGHGGDQHGRVVWFELTGKPDA